MDIFDWIKIIFNHLGICTNGEQWSDASFPNYFKFLRYWGLWFNLNVKNAFTFDSQVGVVKYDVKVDGFVYSSSSKIPREREREIIKSGPKATIDALLTA